MGEEFYHKSSKFEEFIAPFRSLSIIKYNEFRNIYAKTNTILIHHSDTTLLDDCSGRL
uniref:Uncharacterized protein n=1 Tax=Rhizophagus irregularis (strain DAOM 181602 / DAOM 197198 / MUCL 43194) TaxID=747089 RepID=U9SXV5_RHIID